ncbi:MAG: 1-(5-phosphoribosyl)-5-[(5-phosphoribosylamino)methylideneamino]imidazole-4-carboxamide isomerase [Ignavibacterium sp.]|jgi:phosphoribosylformimino-5-aminoimidazole carboxamide ribotide isomerase|nr:1-(5-phosphoribosyl)-5-[(5-phosphoribosylamino)methylideneamino]imidazole-4-carboxamide isomerase [Ignavibacterium sp.]
MKIIPAIDILNNKIVRLERGKFQSSKVYSDNPLDVAKTFDKVGFEWIHIVDLSGSKLGKISTIDLLGKINNQTSLKIQFGGGIRCLEDVKQLRNYVERIIIGSLSVTDKNKFEKIISEFGEQKIICAVDVKDEKVMIKGWTVDSELTLQNHLDYCTSIGIKNILVTDILRDGMLTGPNINLYSKLITNYPSLNFIASGGISDYDDLISLKKISAYAVVVGKAIYENKISLKELKEFVG